MKIFYDQGYNHDIGVVIATKWYHYLFYLHSYFLALRAVLPKSFTRAFSSNSYLNVCEVSLRASSSLGEEWGHERRAGKRKESLQWSLTNFHFHPGNPRTSQNVKTVTAECCRLEKWQLSVKFRQPRAHRIYLFILNHYCNSFPLHQGNVFYHWYVLFIHGTSNFNVSARIRTQYLLNRFLFCLHLKSRPHSITRLSSPSQSPTLYTCLFRNL